MYRFAIYILFLVFFFGCTLYGQNNRPAEDLMIQKDTVESTSSKVLDILDLRTSGGALLINHSASTRQALEDYLLAKPKERKVGYRIIVYYDNDQKARNESKEIEEQLRSAYPGHKVYRSYSSPYFIVYIGNFRTKSDAMALYNDLKLVYDNPKIVKSRISWFSFEQ